MKASLFPTDLPEADWSEFSAEGFLGPVPGVIYRGSKPPVCGVPLGVIDTGCLDLEATGLLGYSTIFNSLRPRRGPMNLPFLGFAIGLQIWVLTTQNMHGRDGIIGSWSGEGERLLRGVKTASEIHYWGHYPVVDMEFVTDAPVEVGLRAWSPFIPGDAAASMLPGAVFEVHLRNRTDEEQKGTLALSMPGPNENEAGTTRFLRRAIKGRWTGVSVKSKNAGYVLGVIGEESVRVGGELGVDMENWVRIPVALPFTKTGSGSTVAVDFALAPGEEKTVRYVFTWCAPVWRGGGAMTPSGMKYIPGYEGPPGGNAYSHMYAARYKSATAAANVLAHKHAALLGRILAWQQVIYAERSLPGWLRDSLVNVLHLITEASVWAQAKPPVGTWCRPEDGVFGMNESPRWCPQIECIPCSFYGNLPLVYFFPEVALSTLRAYKGYQFPDGQVPWTFGGCTVGMPPYEVTLPSRGYAVKPQTTLDGLCYAAMVDRLWRRTGDDAILREFYESVKKNTLFTFNNLRPRTGAIGIVSLPADNDAQDWLEGNTLYGIVPHIGGIHLAQLRIAARMAEVTGDAEFAAKCNDWIRQGSGVLEEQTWTGSYYLLYNEPETGKKSDVVMSCQLDGEWVCRFDGLPGVFPADHVRATLETLKETAVRATKYGAVVFCKPGGKLLEKGEWDPGYWGSEGVHPPSVFMLAMTYMYEGQREFGIELARRTVAEVVRRGWYWDWAVALDTADGPRAQCDPYQNLMLWGLPAAIQGKDLAGPCRNGGLVERMLNAKPVRSARRNLSNPCERSV
jgi:uncharacterized protein (DUF608 family)